MWSFGRAHPRAARPPRAIPHTAALPVAGGPSATDPERLTVDTTTRAARLLEGDTNEPAPSPGTPP